jgi:hypothetical protein
VFWSSHPGPFHAAYGNGCALTVCACSQSLALEFTVCNTWLIAYLVTAPANEMEQAGAQTYRMLINLATALQLIEEETPKKRRGRGKRQAWTGPDGPSEADATWASEAHDARLSHWEECTQCSTWVELGMEAADNAGRPCPSCGEQVNMISCSPHSLHAPLAHTCALKSALSSTMSCCSTAPTWHVQLCATLSS